MPNASVLARSAAIFDRLDVAETTRAEYKWRIAAFSAFVAEHGFGRDSYLDFKRYLGTRGDLSVSTKNKYLAAARVLLRELVRQGSVPDITAGVRFFAQSKKHRQEGLDDAEMDRLSASLREREATPANTRLRALFCLLALQGLRQIEACRLDVADLDLVARTALVQGKGEDDKEPVDLHPQTVRALKGYLRTARVADGPLFPSPYPGSTTGRLTPRAVRLVVRQALDELGIEKTTHGLRHYFTTKLLETYHGDLLEVRQYTRHRSLEMLRVYDDRRKQRQDLPRFHDAFKEVAL